MFKELLLESSIFDKIKKDIEKQIKTMAKKMGGDYESNIQTILDTVSPEEYYQNNKLWKTFTSENEDTWEMIVDDILNDIESSL